MKRALPGAEGVSRADLWPSRFLTPLVDVAFLLLVFFLGATRFTTLERKVAAELPRDGPHT